MTRVATTVSRRARASGADALRWALFLGAVITLVLTTAPIRLG